MCVGGGRGGGEGGGGGELEGRKRTGDFEICESDKHKQKQGCIALAVHSWKESGTLDFVSFAVFFFFH